MLLLGWIAASVAFSPHSAVVRHGLVVGSTPRFAPVRAATATIADELCTLDDIVCTYDPDEIDERFANDPLAVAGRVAEVTAAFTRVKLAGDDDGATLRSELGKLGPVFCKVGQTLATRPDIIGLETSRNLGQLQDAMAPESGGTPVAMATLSEALGDVDAQLRNISAQPIAAASLAEVYRATTPDGQQVAVKIQRPGLERKVALDLHVMRRLLALAQKVFKIGGDVSVVVAVLDEVSAGHRTAYRRTLWPESRTDACAETRLTRAVPLSHRWARVSSASSISPPRPRTSSASIGCTPGSSPSWR